MAMTGYNLDPGEEIVKRINRHWIDQASISLAAGIMIFAALAISYGFGRYRDQFPAFITGGVVAVIIGALLVTAVLILVIGVWVFRRNYVLITSHHLIQVEQQGLLHSQVDQVSLGRIQDVSGVESGLWQTMFNYGTVTVQSAGEARQFIMPRVPDPKPLADEILEMHEKFLQDHPGSDSE